MTDTSKPAFPATVDSGYVVMDDDGKPEHMTAHATGMTLREYYAGLAMKGLLSNPGGPIQANGMSGWGYANCDADTVADFCVAQADALIGALQEDRDDE